MCVDTLHKGDDDDDDDDDNNNNNNFGMVTEVGFNYSHTEPYSKYFRSVAILYDM
jgi:hypothetical protein